MPPYNAAHAKLVTTDTSTASIVAGGATGAATSGTGGFNGGTLKLSAGIAIDGGTLTDHGIVIPSAVPAVTTMALYNNGGNLTWNGATLAAGSSVSGTTGRIGKFTASNAIGDSIITESGTTITVAGTVNVTTAYQIGGFSINTSGTLTNVPYLDTANTFTAAGGQKFTGGISVSAGTQSTAGIMIPSAVPAVTTTNLHNNGGELTWPNALYIGSASTFAGMDSAVVYAQVNAEGYAQIAGTGIAVRADRASDTATLGPQVYLARARGFYSAQTIVQSGDTIATLSFLGYDGATNTDLASIAAFVDGTPGANDMPGRLTFSTTPDGTNALVERLRINNAGNVGIGTTTISARVHVISTTEQVRTGYDASNYYSTTVGSTGAVAFAAVGAGAAFSFSHAVTGTGGFVGNVTGNASGSAATVTTAAQPAITSVGTLTGLTVSGATTLQDDVTLSTTKKLFFGAGADTWIGETTGNQINVEAGGSGGVFLASGATSWTGVSDERLKTDLHPIEQAVAALQTLRTVIGRYRTDAEGTRRPFLLAQDVQRVFPEAVDIGADGVLGLRYTDVLPLVIAAINEQDKRLKTLEGR